MNHGNGNLFQKKQKHRQLKCIICGRKYTTDGSKLIYVSMEKPGSNYYYMGFAHRDCLSRIT